MGLALLAPFAVAARLTPSQRGYGTHQQLGLPPCSFRALFGRRCPSCGATTAWAWLVRGRLAEALKAHVTATVIGLLAATAAGWLLLSAVRGAWVVRPLSDAEAAVMVSTLLAAAAVEWLLRMAGAW